MPPGKRIIGTVADLDKSRWFTIAAGTLVAVGGFVLVLWGVAWLLPRFLRLSDSRWGHVVPQLGVLLTTFAMVAVSFLRRRAKLRDTKTLRLHR